MPSPRPAPPPPWMVGAQILVARRPQGELGARVGGKRVRPGNHPGGPEGRAIAKNQGDVQNKLVFLTYEGVRAVFLPTTVF
jgi:hypothetical protein